MATLKFRNTNSFTGSTVSIALTDKEIWAISSEEYLIKKFRLDIPSTLDAFYDLETLPTAISATSELVCLGNEDGTLHLITENDFGNPKLVNKLSSKVLKILISPDACFLLSSCLESYITSTSLHTSRNFQFLPGHKGSVRNVSIDPKGEYMSSIGCEGVVHIYSFPNKESEEDLGWTPQLLTQLKMSAKTQQNSLQYYALNWNKNGEYLMVAGELYPRQVSRESWEMSAVKGCMHSEEISLLLWVGENMLLTYGLEGEIKLWNIHSIRLLANTQIKEGLRAIEYKKGVVCYMDNEGNLGTCALDRTEGVKGTEEEVERREDVNMDMEQPERGEAGKEGTRAITTNMEEMEIIEREIEEKKAGATPSTPTTPKATKPPKAPGRFPPLEEVIGTNIQDSFQPTETEYTGKSRFLCWNLVGSISMREESSFRCIDIEFSNKGFHKNISMNDIYGIYKGILGYGGAFLGSRAAEVNLDEYDEGEGEGEGGDAHGVGNRRSRIVFVPFHEWRGIREWEMVLKEGENVELLGMGGEWVAFYTDMQYIRILSHSGVQLFVRSQPTPLLAMTGYENLLAIVSHHSLPILGSQSLYLEILDVNSMDTILALPLALSPYNTLSWIGFSAEGTLYTYDSMDICRLLYKESWVPVFEGTSRFWVIGVMEQELLGVSISANLTQQPAIKDLQMIRSVPLSLPFLDMQNAGANDERHLRELIAKEGESIRISRWAHLKRGRDKGNNEYWVSQTIRSPPDILKMETELDKETINSIRKSAVLGQIQKAITYGRMLLQPRSLQMAILLATQMNNSTLTNSLNALLIEKTKDAEMMREGGKMNSYGMTQEFASQNISSIGNNLGNKLVQKRQFANRILPTQRTVEEEMSSNPLASFHNEFGNHINKEESKNENIMRNANKYEQEYLPEAGILSRVESEKYENVNHKLNIVDVLTKGKGFGSDSSNDGNIPTKLSNNPFAKNNRSLQAEKNIFHDLGKGKSNKRMNHEITGYQEPGRNKIMKP